MFWLRREPLPRLKTSHVRLGYQINFWIALILLHAS